MFNKYCVDDNYFVLFESCLICGNVIVIISLCYLFVKSKNKIKNLLTPTVGPNHLNETYCIISLW